MKITLASAPGSGEMAASLSLTSTAGVTRSIERFEPRPFCVCVTIERPTVESAGISSVFAVTVT